MRKVIFGQYPHGENGEIMPISWFVVSEKTDKALLLSEYCIDGHAYHKTAKGVTWKDCTLRTWLNGEFMCSAFSEKEQQQILESEITVYRKEHLNVAPKGLVKDKVFLLSEDEIKKSLDNKFWLCYPTAYADNRIDFRWISEIVDVNGVPVSKYGCYWTTRMRTDPYAFHIACVWDDGKSFSGHDVRDRYGIRPAIWVDKAVVAK